MFGRGASPPPPPPPPTDFYASLYTAEPRWDVQLTLLLANLIFWCLLNQLILMALPGFYSRFAYFRELKTDCWRLMPPGPVERAGFDTKYGYCCWTFVALHHVVAGGLVLASYLNPDDGGALFRHGTLVALGGVDVAQILQLSLKLPPFDETPPAGKPLMDGPLIAHHIYGVLVILPANLYLSTDVDVTLVAISGLLASGVNCVIGLMSETLDPLKPCNATRRVSCYVAFLLIFCFNLASFCFFRWYLFPVHTYRALLKFHEISGWLSGSIAVASAFLGLFNVVVLLTMGQNFIGLVGGLLAVLKQGAKVALETPESPSSRALRRASSSPFGTELARIQGARARWGSIRSNLAAEMMDAAGASPEAGKKVR